MPSPKKTAKPKKPAEPKKRKGKNKGGRPLFDGKDEKLVLTKLEAAFSVGATDEEACLHADISPRALYRYEKGNPEFRQRKALLKEKLILVARQNYSEVMHERDPMTGELTPRAVAMSRWYGERKRKSEFSPQASLLTEDTQGVLTEERKQEIAGAMANWETPDDEFVEYADDTE